MYITYEDTRKEILMIVHCDFLSFYLTNFTVKIFTIKYLTFDSGY